MTNTLLPLTHDERAGVTQQKVSDLARRILHSLKGIEGAKKIAK